MIFLDVLTSVCIAVNTFMTVFCMNKITAKSSRYFMAGFNLVIGVLNSAILVAKHGPIGLLIAMLCIAVGLFVYYRTNGV